MKQVEEDLVKGTRVLRQLNGCFSLFQSIQCSHTLRSLFFVEREDGMST